MAVGIGLHQAGFGQGAAQLFGQVARLPKWNPAKQGVERVAGTIGQVHCREVPILMGKSRHRCLDQGHFQPIDQLSLRLGERGRAVGEEG
jgi:hypothetical protein